MSEYLSLYTKYLVANKKVKHIRISSVIRIVSGGKTGVAIKLAQRALA